MRRRDAVRGLAVVGSTCLAGCGTFGGSSGGSEDEPFEVGPEALLPDVSVLEEAVDVDWEPREEIETGLAKRAQAKAAYQESGHDRVYPDAVEVGAWTFEDVAAARSHYDDLPYHEGWGMSPGDVGVESLQGVVDDGREYRAVFRDANAIGGLVYLNRRMGNDDRMRSYGRDLAVAMHRSWRE